MPPRRQPAQQEIRPGHHKDAPGQNVGVGTDLYSSDPFGKAISGSVLRRAHVHTTLANAEVIFGTEGGIETGIDT